jgi:hypothetical protein
MAEYENRKAGKGWLNINEAKQGKQPDWKGSFTAEVDIPAGTKFWLSAWNGTDRDGKDSISVSGEMPRAGAQQQRPARHAPPRAEPRPAPRHAPPSGADMMDDEIPF